VSGECRCSSRSRTRSRVDLVGCRTFFSSGIEPCCRSAATIRWLRLLRECGPTAMSIACSTIAALVRGLEGTRTFKSFAPSRHRIHGLPELVLKPLEISGMWMSGLLPAPWPRAKPQPTDDAGALCSSVGVRLLSLCLLDGRWRISDGVCKARVNECAAFMQAAAAKDCRDCRRPG